MSTRANVAIKINDEDINKNVSFDNIHYLKLNKPYLEIYVHHDGYPNNFKKFITDNNLFNYKDILNYILQGDRTSFDVPYIECNESWADNKPYLYSEKDYQNNDIPEDYYYIFINNTWYYKCRNDKNNWLKLFESENNEIAIQQYLTHNNDSENIGYLIKKLVEKITNGKYTTNCADAITEGLIIKENK